MRTPKIEALYRLIDWLNARSKTTSLRHPSLENQQITKLGLDDSDLGDNPWLSGFIEADGNFYSAFDLNSEGVAGLVRHYMRISKKTTYGKSGSESTENNSNLGVMDKLKDFLDVKNVTSRKRIKENYTETSYEVRTSKISSCEILINYLSKYPLFSSKHQDYLSRCEIHELRVSKKYKTIEGTARLIFLKNSMNTLRTKFNWDSLNRFYTI